MNYKAYIFLAIFTGMFPVLVWIYPTENTLFQVSVTGIFSALMIASVIQSMRLKKMIEERPMIIRHGNHKIDDRPLMKCSGSLDFEFTFEPQHSYYSIHNPKQMNQAVNKLIGMSSWDIHDYSVRIGWRNTKNNRFSLFAYIYKDGKRESIYLTNVFPGQTVTGSITQGLDAVAIRVNDKGLMITGIKKELILMTWPYFGGNHPAPWDMEFDVKFQI